MTVLSVNTNASLDAVSAQRVPFISGLFAGEALDAVVPCYIHTDGLVYELVSTSGSVAANAAKPLAGFTADSVAIGGPVTLFRNGARFDYSAGLTPGAMLYPAATAGLLSASAVNTNDSAIALVVTASDIIVK